MKKRLLVVLLALTLMVLMGCAGPAEPVEVTRLVTEQIPVTVEVTRVVVQEVAVEVTRLVEAAPTAEATAEPTVVPTVEVEPSPTPEPTATTAVTGVTYTVQPGDTLSTIADQTGTTIAELQAANNLDSSSFLIAGQELLIPGLEGEVTVVQAAAPAATEATVEAPPAAAAAAGANLLPNSSFEGDWYFYLYNELQVPEGWQLATDEGANNLENGAGGVFNRPEVRVVPAKDLPPSERGQFIFDGNKTVKAFKGGAPTSFSLFTDVALQPGSYRMSISFFPDTVAGYDNQLKTFASDPLAAEARIIVDGGGTAWQGTAIGQRNTLTFDFTVDQARTVRVGGSFRNRYIMANNGWFLDGWSLMQLDSAQ